ncbi:MAG: zf-HC2 domain-containing protein [Halopseudomonas sp.]|uniref:anti-sigma factor family protein n=1 Tax=Halopseudomonas sp. TaxID=2901191 RepID=UPI003001F499
MLTCRDLVARSSDLLDGELGLRQRLALRAHLAVCFRCRRFIRQLRVTQRVIRQLPDAPLPELERLVSAMLAQQKAATGDSARQHSKPR